MKFFLSYASDHDKKAAEEIKDELEKLEPSSPHEVFVDYASLLKSQDADFEINKRIERADAVLYLITVSSIRSFWCGKEIGYAQCLGKPIVPIAGCGITGEFIKSQSIPLISGLKWVNWRENGRAQRIVDGVADQRDILKLLTPSELERLTLVESQSGDHISYGIVNTREFRVSDLSVASEIRITENHKATMFGDAPKVEFLYLDGGMAVDSGLALSRYKRPSTGGLTRAWLVEGLRTRQIELPRCRVILLFRYCIGGQHYLSSLFDQPLVDVCPAGLKTALLNAAAAAPAIADAGK
jgi:hypothetical protein